MEGEEFTERWSNRAGVILAVAGSAVGLGNFLRFPGQAAQYGGGAFMLAYFIALILIGLPLCWAEWSMGRSAGQAGYHSCPGILYYLLGKRWGKYIGVIGIVIPVIIYMYYAFIESWCLAYAAQYLFGGMEISSVKESTAAFLNFTGAGENGSVFRKDFKEVGIFLCIVCIINFWMLYRGISRGIELFCMFAMPLLFICGVLILVRVLTLGVPNVQKPENSLNNGLGFMWNPSKIVLEENVNGEWERREDLIGQVQIEKAELRALSEPNLRIRKMGPLELLRNPQLWLAAAGQVFFSLSVGFGIILTYASYLRREDDVVLSGFAACSTNGFCEVALGGLITIPAAVAFLGVAGVAGQGTFGLGFVALPMVFTMMPWGNFFGFLFYFFLFLAAITSSISMLQPGIAFLEEAMKVKRRTSCLILGSITTAGMLFVVYFSKDFKALDTLDFWAGTFLIFFLASIQIVLFSWILGVESGLQEAEFGALMKIPKIFKWILRWVSPVFLLVVSFSWFWLNVLGMSFGGKKGEVSGYIKDLFIEPDKVAQMAVGLILAFGLWVFYLVIRSERYDEQNMKWRDR